MNRRHFLTATMGGLACAGLSNGGWASPIGIARSRCLEADDEAIFPFAPTPRAPAVPSPAIMARARAALSRHHRQFSRHDRIGIVDFSRPSRDHRLFIVDLVNGRTQSFLVSHGRGSDPDHIGWVEWFSNEPGSLASSNGTYLTSDFYFGQHGRSMRLVGLDSVNNNAEARAIVVHAAWYVSPDLAYTQGKIGRSEGCFAVSFADLDWVLGQLGPGRMIYADRI